MTKEFCSYEQSLSLKELGFNEPCFGFYERDKELIIQECEITDFHFDSLQCIAPTFSQAFRFFREKYLIFGTIKVDQTMEPKFCYSISTYEPSQFTDGWNDDVYNSDLYYTYEEAESACLNKLIEIVKNK